MKSSTSQFIIEDLVTEMQGRQLLAENISNETVSFLVNLPGLVGITKGDGGKNQAKQSQIKDQRKSFYFS